MGELAGELAPHQLSTVLWALGKLQAYPGIEVMETLLMRCCLSLPNHPPQVQDLPMPPSPQAPPAHYCSDVHVRCQSSTWRLLMAPSAL